MYSYSENLDPCKLALQNSREQIEYLRSGMKFKRMSTGTYNT